MHLGGLAMTLIKYKLGNLITQRREKYDGINELPIRGVSREGFISAKQPGADTSLYNVYYKMDFVFNPARMEINSIALNTEFDKAICSSLYEIFYVSRQDLILPEYLNLFIKRQEFARQCEFIGWGSAREYCRVSDISDIDIVLPPIEIQKKYVDVYKTMVANQKSYEQGLEDLKTTIDALIDEHKHKAKRLKVGDIVKEIDERNSDNVITDVQGINITKQFMKSVADTSNVNLKKYKIVRNGQFAYSGMQTGRDECIRIALYDKVEPIIISPAYTVLEVVNGNVLPEYFMMWFSRNESDRRGWFMSDSSIRANLDLERFYETEVPVPALHVQKAIVNIYNAYIDRRNISERLKARISELCPILIKGSLEEGNA